MKLQSWGRKAVPAFTLPPHRLRWRPRSNRHPLAAVIHNGLSTEKLSTSLPAALCKTFSPSRLRTRIYNISFARWPLPGSVRAAPGKSPRRCGTVSCAAVRRVGEGEGKGGRPLAQCRTMPLVCRITVRKGGSAQGKPRPCPCVLPATACLRPSPCPLMGELPCAGWGRAKAKADAPSRSAEPCRLLCRITVRKVGSAQGQPRPCPCVLPAATCLRPRPRRLNGYPGSAGGRENDRMAHRRITTPTHQTPRGNDTCTIRVPRRKGAQSVVHNLYFSSSRPASFCTTFPQSCTDRPATRRKEHKSSLEGLIFRVLPPLFTAFLPKAIVQNTPAAPPFSPRKTPRLAPTRNRARTLASAGRDNTPRPAHSSRFQRDTNESAARRKLIFAPPKAENGGVFGLKC